MNAPFPFFSAARYPPLATDLTAREVNAQRMEANRDFH